MNQSMEQEELIKACKRGERPAQKQLYEQHAPVMLGICYRYTSSIQEAEDVLQDAFVRVFSKLDQFREEGELGAWIRRIVVNCALNNLKKKQPKTSSWEDQPETEHPPADADPMITIQAKELANLIRQLPDGYRIVFNLHAIEGYTHEEIGKMMGIRTVSSRTQYMRARALLAQKLIALQENIKSSAHGK
jgi:RNA polymerase sigma-70 factor (ECF subfamily)